MNKYQSLTMLIVIIVAFALGIYDFWVADETAGYGTISWVLYTQALKRPALPFLFGFLFGHIFGQMPTGGGD